jgi:hypothetical protein
MRTFVAALALLIPFAAQGQKPTPYGAVSGTVTCIDNNLPARLIDITLQPVPDPKAPQTARSAGDAGQVLSVHQTHLDGTFLIPRIAPGRYYVVAQKPGYLSPVALYTVEDVEHPSPELRKMMDEVIPQVTVVANQTSSIDLRLARAASISGVVRWDDGSPAPGLSVRLRHKGKDGKWTDTKLASRIFSDDLGRFRAAGLPAAEYQLAVRIESQNHLEQSIFGGRGSTSTSRSVETLYVYFGDTFFRKDAKPIELDDGQDATADLTIPVSKLHTLSGALVDASNGHVINAGSITFNTLPAADGRSEELGAAEVDADDSTFRIEFIPEGTYTVHVQDARDVIRELVPPPAGRVDFPEVKETVLKRYSSFDAPYTVENDAAGITFPLSAAKPAATVTATTR